MNAGFAPSATKDPAKPRRSQVITRGRETTWLRTDAAGTPYPANTRNAAQKRPPAVRRAGRRVGGAGLEVGQQPTRRPAR
ncbi:hypothetical protein GCM10009535_56470 [Streptomyces thermocarboxydovorans]|uniref:Uncharacterized protein n=1 Tax=Streptomyces thermocarboxydovorans TaxID=59298 RepID=A0ABP3T1Y3_9ACTN